MASATSSPTVPALLEELAGLLANPTDADSFEALRAQLLECVNALRAQFVGRADQGGWNPPADAATDLRTLLELAVQARTRLYVAVIRVERLPLIATRYGQAVANQVMQVCRQHLSSRILGDHDQMVEWANSGVVAVLQRDENLQGARSELLRVLAAPVNQYFETDHRTIYLPIRMSGDLLPVTGTAGDLLEQVQKYFPARD